MSIIYVKLELGNTHTMDCFVPTIYFVALYWSFAIEIRNYIPTAAGMIKIVMEIKQEKKTYESFIHFQWLNEFACHFYE